MTRRELLKGGTALGVAAALDQALPSPAQAQTTQKKELVTAQGGDIAKFDPHFSTSSNDIRVSFNLFDNLTSRDELGNAARFSVDEKFRGEAYRDITKIFLENLPWIPVIQPYEDYGIQKHVEWTPNPNQQFEIRRFNLKFKRA